MPRKKVKPSLKQNEAFEFYYMLGYKRTLTAVAEKFNIGMRTVARWSVDLCWQKQVTERDAVNKKAIERKTNAAIVAALTDNKAAIVATKAKYRAVISKAIAIFISNLKAGKVRVKTIQDAERLIKLDLFLLGEPTERVEARPVISMDAFTDAEVKLLEQALQRAEQAALPATTVEIMDIEAVIADAVILKKAEKETEEAVDV